MGSVGELAGLYEEAAAELLEQVRGKARWVAALTPEAIGGATPDTVARVIDVASTHPASAAADSDIMILSVTPPLAGLVGGGRGGEVQARARRAAIETCRDFVDEVFAPAVEQQWHEFVRLCDDVDDGCRRTYAVIADALTAVGPEVFGPDGGAVGSHPEPRSPDAAAVHSTATHGGSGLEVGGPAPPGGPDDGGAVLASADGTGGDEGVPAAGTGTGSGAQLAGVGPVPRPAEISHAAAWDVLDAAFTEGSHTWPSIADVLAGSAASHSDGPRR